MRKDRPFVFSHLRSGQGVGDIVDFIVDNGGLEQRAMV
jgi:urease accessory protein